MEDQQNGYLYEIASPLELGVSDYRDQALIVWHHGEDARDGPAGAGDSRRGPERGPVERRPAAAPD